MVHAGQNRIYPGGIGKYAFKFGFSNIEFEAKLTLDLISYVNGGAFDLGAGPDNYDEYVDWVIALCGETIHPKFPSMSTYSGLNPFSFSGDIRSL